MIYINGISGSKVAIKDLNEANTKSCYIGKEIHIDSEQELSSFNFSSDREWVLDYNGILSVSGTVTGLFVIKDASAHFSGAGTVSGFKQNVEASWWSVGLKKAIESAILSGVEVNIREDTSIYIPSTSDSINAAINGTYPVGKGTKVSVILEAGYKIKEGVLLRDSDYRQYEVSSVESTVFLDPSYPQATCVLKCYNADAPRWSLLIDCESNNVNDTNVDGTGLGAISLVENSTIVFGEGAGAIGGYPTNSGLFLYKGGKAIGSGCIFKDFGVNNLWITHESDAYLEEVTATGAGSIGAFVSRASRLYAPGGDFSNAGTYGAQVYRSRFMCYQSGLRAGKFNACGTAGVFADEVALVSVPMRAGMATEFHDLPNHGIIATNGSIVNAIGVDFSNITYDAVRCTTSSEVVVTGATFSGIGRDSLACGGTAGGGVISANLIQAPSSGRYCINCVLGGKVIANSSNMSGSTDSSIYCESGGKVEATNANLDGCTSSVAAIQCIAGEVSAWKVSAKSCASRGAWIKMGGVLNVSEGDLSLCAVGGIRAETGSTVKASSCNAQTGASAATSDVQCNTGSTIHFSSGVGGVNVTTNTISPSGIIFR